MRGGEAGPQGSDQDHKCEGGLKGEGGVTRIGGSDQDLKCEGGVTRITSARGE